MPENRETTGEMKRLEVGRNNKNKNCELIIIIAYKLPDYDQKYAN